MRAARLGWLSAILGSVCCLGPLLLALLGLGSVGVGAWLGRAHWWFTGAAMMLLIAGWCRYVTEQARCRSGQCQMVRPTRTRWALVTASVIVAGFAGLNAWAAFGPVARPITASVAADGRAMTIPTKGMTCAMCELAIEQRLAKQPGVFHVDAQAAAEQVIVTYDARTVDLRELMAVIEQAGYQTHAPAERASP